MLMVVMVAKTLVVEEVDVLIITDQHLDQVVKVSLLFGIKFHNLNN